MNDQTTKESGGTVMTVGELRAMLNMYPDDTRVLVDGYEDGYNDPTLTGPCTMVLLESNAEWEGNYDLYRSADRDARAGDAFDAIVLSR